MTGHSRKKCLVPFVNVEVFERAETGGFRFQETKKPGVASGDGSRSVRAGQWARYMLICLCSIGVGGLEVSIPAENQYELPGSGALIIPYLH